MKALSNTQKKTLQAYGLIGKDGDATIALHYMLGYRGSFSLLVDTEVFDFVSSGEAMPWYNVGYSPEKRASKHVELYDELKLKKEWNMLNFMEKTGAYPDYTHLGRTTASDEKDRRDWLTYASEEHIERIYDFFFPNSCRYRRYKREEKQWCIGLMHKTNLGRAKVTLENRIIPTTIGQNYSLNVVIELQ